MMDGCNDGEAVWGTGGVIYISQASLMGFIQEILQFDLCCGSLHLLGQLVPQTNTPIIWAFLDFG